MSQHSQKVVVDFKKVNMRSKTQTFTDDMGHSSFVFPTSDTGGGGGKRKSEIQFPKIGRRRNNSTQPQRKFR